jgi:DNA (cytosine-5)-methyltransferase 1
MARQSPIPVIDLFAGPGGLGEGFSSIVDGNGERRFSLRVSIEMDPVAHRTLSLRALFRAFRKGAVPDCYYDYVRGDISREELFSHPSIPEETSFATSEAKNAELGKTPHKEIDGWIEKAIGGANQWVLIGGPPCQAYSVAGRSRRAKEDLADFESDKRHLLYTEYLRIIRRFGPSVFVMENVKGILSSKHSGSRIFDRILADLASPGDGLEYRIHSFVVEGTDLEPNDFVIQSERFGIPQNRHRVILFGIRSDLADATPTLARHPDRFILEASPKPVSVKSALSGLPPLRSRLSKEPDSHKAWLSVLKNATDGLKGWRNPIRLDMEESMSKACRKASAHSSYGGRFDPCQVVMDPSLPSELRSWFHDPCLGGVLQHDTRSHMRSDLHRYLFASCYAKAYKSSPKLRQFPPRLLPDHVNATPEQVAEDAPFVDRFRVQLAGFPSTTVVAHIAKDGHYFIHPDPSQCRSLTVREAARLQTFPDNYFFEGGRTDQYTQIGNAVPPLLARKIAEIVLDFLTVSRPR